MHLSAFVKAKKSPVSSVSQPLCSVGSCKPVSAAPECTSFSYMAMFKMYDTMFRGSGDPHKICSRLAWQLLTSWSDTLSEGLSSVPKLAWMKEGCEDVYIV